MSKRGATTELTDRNWDQEDEPEEAGVFTQASSEVLKERIFKKAKRKVAGHDSNESKTSAFSGFGGLSAKSQSSTPFSGGISSFVGASSFQNGNETVGKKSKETVDENEKKYLESLKGLNESVLSWIKQHVEKNPYIILTPIFADYDKYLKGFDKKEPVSDKSENNQGNKIKSSETAFKQAELSVPFTSSGISSLNTDGKGDEKPKSLFSFGDSGVKPVTFSTSSTVGQGGFQFGKTSASSSSAASTLSKPTGAGFFAPATAPEASSQSKGGEKDDDEYVPPVPEVKEIKEDDAIYSKRCKLFYKKEDQWADRGVGNLHLKPVPENKTQILVRADTNLGNVILNVMLTSSMPVKRQGKNNVFIVCVPNPPINNKEDTEKDTTPVPMLIRVKTESDADDLFKCIEERKTLL